MTIECHYHPSKPQRRFHATESDEVMYGGEIGGGKTAAIVMDAMLTACKYPGVTIYLFRATYQQGQDTLLEEIEQLYPKGIGRYNKQDTTYYFENGSKMKIRQCKTLADAKKNEGKEFSKLYIDEAQHLNFDAFDYLCTRPRANKLLKVKPQVKFSAMQGGQGHGWIRKAYVSPLEPNVPKLMTVTDIKTGEKYKMYREFIPASLEDNLHIDRKYAGRLAMRSEKVQRKTRTSDWNDLEGQAFPEWVDAPTGADGKKTDKWTHVVEAFPVPSHWQIYRGFDYGSAAPYSVLWFAKADETMNNRLFLIHELYGGNDNNEGLRQPVSVIAENIARIEKALLETHGYIDGVADPSIFSKSPFGEESIASVMEEHGVTFRDPRYDKEVVNNIINNRMQGKQLIHEALRFDTEGYPAFQVFDKCKRFRDHFPALMTDPDNPEDVATKGTEDHDYDACRYVIVLTKPRVQEKKVLPYRRRFDPLNFGDTRREDTGKVIKLPDLIIGG